MSIVDGQYRHGLRRMRGRSTDQHGRTATPLELLYDLTFVAAFGVAGNQLAHGIAENHASAAIGSFVFAMFAIVWSWINFSWFASAFDTDDWAFRLLTMVQMVGVIVLAIGLPALFTSFLEGGVIDNGLVVAGYLVMRIALVVQWLRVAASDPRYRTVALTYAGAVSIAQVGWVVLLVLALPASWMIAGAVVLYGIELLGPVLAERKGARHGGGATPWHAHHMAERYALLTIIALGETVFGTLASASAITEADGWSVDAVVVVAAGVALGFALWWVYFLLPHAEILHARRDKAFPWGYGHIALFTAIAAVGAGLHVVGYSYDPHYEVDTVTVVGSVAVPVLVFMVVLYLLYAWLMSTFTLNLPLQILVMALPLVAIVLAVAGSPAWACLLVVLASPASLIVSYESGAWRGLQRQLDAVVKAAAGR